MSETTVTADSASPETLTPFQTFSSILLRPRIAFETIRQSERSYWWIVMLLAAAGVILLAIGSTIAQSAMFEALTENLPEGADVQMPPAGMFQIISLVMGIVAGLIGLGLGYLIQAGIVYGLSLALGGRSSFKQIFQMSVWSRLPDVIRSFLQAAAVFVTGNLPAPGLSGVLTAEEAADMRVLDTLLGRFDLYLIWGFLLLAVGATITARLSRSKGFLISFIYFAMVIGVGLAFSAAAGALAGALGPG